MSGLEHAKQTTSQGEGAVTTALLCEHCHQPFTPHPENAEKQRFCADRCRVAWHREHPKPNKHSFHRMHENSLEAYRYERGQLSARAQAIVEWVREHGPSTDRDVMRGLGFTDPNTVRPRITALVDGKQMREVGSRTDTNTGKSVRVVDVPRGPAQMRLIA